MTPSTLGDQVLEVLRHLAPSAQSEAFFIRSEHRTQEWSEGRPENLSISKSRGMGLRVVDQGKLGFASTNRLDPEGLSWLAEAAVDASHVTGADSQLELPKPQTLGKGEDLDLVDETLRSQTFEERSEFLSSLEEKVKKRDSRLRKVLRASYREGCSDSAITSSTGVTAWTCGTSLSFSLACVATQGAETQVGYGFQAVRHYEDLRIDRVIDRTLDHTLSLLGGQQVPSGRYNLLLDPLVSAEMLELLASALRADQVLKGRSFLGMKVGERIASACVTLLDDGCLKRGLGSSPFDAEGMPTQTTTVIQDGVLKGFLYDSASARKVGQVSTGNAGRSSYKGLPEPESTNFFVKPGNHAPDDLLKGAGTAIYVRNVMGLHTVDTVSGDYSLGIMGEKIEGGKRSHGVRGVTIAGNLLDLFRNIEAVGNDLVFYGSVGSPTLWIKGISVGGT